MFTLTRPEGNNIRKGSVTLVIPGLDLDEIRRVWRESFNGCRHLVTNDTFNDPITIPLRAIRRVENDVTRNLAVRLLGRLPIQIYGRRILFDWNDRQIPRWRRRGRLKSRVRYYQTPRTFPPILLHNNKMIKLLLKQETFVFTYLDDLYGEFKLSIGFQVVQHAIKHR